MCCTSKLPAMSDGLICKLGVLDARANSDFRPEGKSYYKATNSQHQALYDPALEKVHKVGGRKDCHDLSHTEEAQEQCGPYSSQDA